MTTPISDDQLQAIARFYTFEVDRYSGSAKDVVLLLQALRERDATITRHIAAFDREREVVERLTQRVAELEVELAERWTAVEELQRRLHHDTARIRSWEQELGLQLTCDGEAISAAIAELRKPVEVEINKEVELIRFEWQRDSLTYIAQCEREGMLIDLADANYAVAHMLRHYDTLAQQSSANDVRWRRASDVWRAEMEGMRESQRILQAANDLLDDQVGILGEHLDSTKAILDVTQERERRLREALQSLIRGYVSMLESARDRIISYGGQCDSVEMMERGDPHLKSARDLLAALAQPQQQESDNGTV